MENIISKLNKIFTHCQNNFDNVNVKKTRKSKISLNNVIEYAIKYSQINSTKRDVLSSIKIYAHRTSYDRKLKNIYP